MRSAELVLNSDRLGSELPTKSSLVHLSISKSFGNFDSGSLLELSHVDTVLFPTLKNPPS